MKTETEATIMLFVMVGLIIFDAVQTLICVVREGVMKNERDILLNKTNAELRSMLKGVTGISKLKKIQLVDLVLQVQTV